MSMIRKLRSDDRGVTAIEFATVAPLMIGMMVGMTQMGVLFFANADLRNAVAAGARTASIFPTPSDAVILDAVDDQVAGLRKKYLTAPTIAKGTDAAGNPWIEISMAYKPPLNFVFFEMPAVTLREKRRVFTAQNPALNGALPPTSTGAGSTSSGVIPAEPDEPDPVEPTPTTTTGGTDPTPPPVTPTPPVTPPVTEPPVTQPSSSGSNASSGSNNGSSSGHDHGGGKDKPKK